MKREIKFRAWNRRTNKMLEWEFLLRIMNNTGGGGASVFKSSELILMQFTELADKAGDEIFDGDKVKRRVHLVEGKDYMDYICVVTWNGWCYGLVLVNTDKQLWGLDPITARECKIIGNIYENPELLQTNK